MYWLFEAIGDCRSKWDLTFDMSGGPKGAKRPLERPLDGGVRCLRRVHGEFSQPERDEATLRGRIRRRRHQPQTLALRYPAGLRAALNIEPLRNDDGLDVRGVLLTAGQALPDK